MGLEVGILAIVGKQLQIDFVEERISVFCLKTSCQSTFLFTFKCLFSLICNSIEVIIRISVLILLPKDGFRCSKTRYLLIIILVVIITSLLREFRPFNNLILFFFLIGEKKKPTIPSLAEFIRLPRKTFPKRLVVELFKRPKIYTIFP